MALLEQSPETSSRRRRWLRFLVGLAALLACVAFFASGYSPPGVFGEVLRHNQACDIDASPLFYTEIEHMSALEEGLAEMRNVSKKQHSKDVE